MRTEKQREAARRNGAKSRGPVTPDGKTKSSRNSLRHGLYSRDGSPENNALAVELHSRLLEVPISDPHRAFLQIRTIREFEASVLSAEVVRQREIDPSAEQEILTLRAYRRLFKETRILDITSRLGDLLSKQASREVGFMLEADQIEAASLREEMDSNEPPRQTVGGTANEKETPRNEPAKAACAGALTTINSPGNEPDENASPKNEMPRNEPGDAASEKNKTLGNEPGNQQANNPWHPTSRFYLRPCP